MNSSSRTVRTQNSTTRADYWTPTEATRVTSCHRLLLVDVVGLNPLVWNAFLTGLTRSIHNKKKQ